MPFNFTLVGSVACRDPEGGVDEDGEDGNDDDVPEE
jgi:hypothetical protein